MATLSRNTTKILAKAIVKMRNYNVPGLTSAEETLLQEIAARKQAKALKQNENA